MTLRLAILGALLSQTLGDMCQWHTDARTDCGYYGISELDCYSKKCCWRPSTLEGEPWCFLKEEKICNLSPKSVDCGYVGISPQECRQRGCCWQPRPIASDDGSGHTTWMPWCFHGGSANKGHVVKDVTTKPQGVELTLEATENSYSTYGVLLSPLQVEITYETDTRLHVIVKDPKTSRWQVPDEVSPRPSPVNNLTDPPKYRLSHAAVGELFWIAITRDTGETLFNSTGLPFEVTAQYIEISTSLPTGAGIYGLGERLWPFRLTPATYTLFGHDTPMPAFNNLYGMHPVYLQLTAQGDSHLVYIRTSNALDVTLQQQQITYRLTGGVLDLYIAMGPTPHQSLHQYSEIVGFPALPPVWSLGFHQSRYGYSDLEEVMAVVSKYKEANISLEAMWLDIDYMDAKKDFTWDPKRFPIAQVKEFAATLHAHNQRLVAIVDPSISATAGYKPYDTGREAGVFITTQAKKELQGKSWAGDVVFPDFFNPKASVWWSQRLAQFMGNGNDSVTIDGLWLDMNEPSNFCDGLCKGKINITLDLAPTTGHFYPNRPPYPVNHQNSRLPLHIKTLPMDAVHYGGLLEYDVHNLYGAMQAKTTATILANATGIRPFLLTRSTYPGSGQHTAHWSGDNSATWEHLAASIASVLNFQIFQIPMTGADICGFELDTEEELCVRWTQLGAFYPFSRNHNAKGRRPQELYQWPSVAATARKYLTLRVRLALYLYSIFYEAHVHGHAVARPLFFEFPYDSATHSLEHEFLLGPALLVSPVVQPKATVKLTYIPIGRWYDLLSYEPLSANYSQGGNVPLPAPLDTIPVLLRGGHILPLFETPSMTVAETWKTANVVLVMALDHSSTATGSIYIDDGISLKPSAALCVSFLANATGMASTVEMIGKGMPPGPHSLTGLHLIGFDAMAITSATVNGQNVIVEHHNNFVELKGFICDLSSPLTVKWFGGENSTCRLRTSNLAVGGLAAVMMVVMGLIGGCIGSYLTRLRYRRIYLSNN